MLVQSILSVAVVGDEVSAAGCCGAGESPCRWPSSW